MKINLKRFTFAIFMCCFSPQARQHKTNEKIMNLTSLHRVLRVTTLKFTGEKYGDEEKEMNKKVKTTFTKSHSKSFVCFDWEENWKVTKLIWNSTSWIFSIRTSIVLDDEEPSDILFLLLYQLLEVFKVSIWNDYETENWKWKKIWVWWRDEERGRMLYENLCQHNENY